MRTLLRASLKKAPLRCFASSTRLREVRALEGLPEKALPHYLFDRQDLGILQWSAPLKNCLLIRKDGVNSVNESLTELARHLQQDYPEVNLIVEKHVADSIHTSLSAPIFSHEANDERTLQEKVDLVVTLGGDGTILHAASLFANTPAVPPILSFSMGTLGFLGEWKFAEYKRAFREVYMSGAQGGYGSDMLGHDLTGWSSIRGKAMGSGRGAKVLRRSRLKVGIYGPDGAPVSSTTDIHAMNEVIIHRGGDPHLAIVEVFVGGRLLTEAVADGMIVSTPTGSTAYNLSSGGSIIHPLVSSLLLTPVCPRSLSFRPLVLPANTPITLRLSKKNRSKEVDVSIDGAKLECGLRAGMELRVSGEEDGGIPCVMRGQFADEDGWVGGLNGLLKFNYPFGEES